jgi:hypothetical protein
LVRYFRLLFSVRGRANPRFAQNRLELRIDLITYKSQTLISIDLDGSIVIRPRWKNKDRAKLLRDRLECKDGDDFPYAGFISSLYISIAISYKCAFSVNNNVLVDGFVIRGYHLRNSASLNWVIPITLPIDACICLSMIGILYLEKRTCFLSVTSYRLGNFIHGKYSFRNHIIPRFPPPDHWNGLEKITNNILYYTLGWVAF